jgi:hypothetical protein
MWRRESRFKDWRTMSDCLPSRDPHQRNDQYKADRGRERNRDERTVQSQPDECANCGCDARDDDDDHTRQRLDQVKD